jgi:uncharacterized protein (TIGR04255 family)
MPEPLHYARAPITEATIELRVIAVEGMNIARLEDLQRRLRDQYPESHPIYQQQITLPITDSSGPLEKSEQIGFRLLSADKQRVAHIQLASCAFSWLYPYDRWEPFRDAARELWSVYRQALRPAEITRIAVRYINRLDVPLPSIEVKDYLRTVPEVSADLPQTLISYFMQLVIPHPEAGAVAMINQALVPPQAPGTTSLILDIDLYRDQDVPSDDETVWALFERLREGKNKIFQACLTPQTEALIS